MKTLLSLFLAVTACAWSQSAPAFNVTSGAAAAPINLCGDSQNVGSVYNRYGNPTNGIMGPFYCVQTGANTLGAGAFSWVAPVLQSSTATSGTINVANGKAAVISNSLTFAGTDATTITTPSTSATMARTDAAQTFTGVQTFSSAPVIATITNTGTVTLPTSTGGVPVLYGCGATSGSTTCANTSGGATARVLTGIATLASNSAVISGISPAFTGTTTYSCVANDLTTRANPVQIANTSSSSVTITNTTGASDVINWVCVGY